MSKTVVLAFSGGLDTSFCVPYLKDRGWDVVTLFVDTGGVSDEHRAWIEERALGLGAREHVTQEAGDELWESFVVPFVMGGTAYQDQYPLLCSDRYLIASRAAALSAEIGAAAIAHGCTAMGNDQVRFDQSLRCLTDLPILAPIREIQAETDEPRAFEIKALERLGFEVSRDVSRYTINENVLGVTVSGSEIDGFGAPSAETYRLTVPPEKLPAGQVSVRVGFEGGRAVTLDGRPLAGSE
ncbi:MAG: argininosuccinate synthase domain-containing protein, partial [Phycisphaerales bacterium JB059]